MRKTTLSLVVLSSVLTASGPTMAGLVTPESRPLRSELSAVPDNQERLVLSERQQERHTGEYRVARGDFFANRPWYERVFVRPVVNWWYGKIDQLALKLDPILDRGWKLEKERKR